MRIAALYDIHGNVAALDAVLNELNDVVPDLVVLGGDLAWGPFPHETLARLREIAFPTVAIRGNADRELLEPDAGEDWVAEVNAWCRNRLDEGDRDYLRALAFDHRADVAGLGEVYFCHASPRSDDDSATIRTPTNDLAEIFGAAPSSTVVFGHTHTQMERAAGGKRIVNAGSVGMPYEEAPGAYWALLGDRIDLRRTIYDFEAAAERVAASGCPYAEEFAKEVVTPTPPHQASEVFEAARLRR